MDADANRRTDTRYTLSPLAQQGASLVILAADGTEEKVRLLDFSRQGLRLEGATPYQTGTALQFRLESHVLGAPWVKFAGQVRWCQPVPDAPATFQAGVSVDPGAEPGWVDLFAKIFEYLKQLDSLSGPR
ncbi:MAG: PilZ domain-containing protein [candidate division NC10 bacterium]|nr:PilZ domain-containing protein [candidate division NC10 bacterium]